MSRGSFNSLLSSFPRRIALDVKRSRQAEYKSRRDERAAVEDISSIEREREMENRSSACSILGQDLLASHKERRNAGSTPQYENIIGLKPEGIQQCAELSCSPGTCNAISRFRAVHCHVRTSGFQVGTCVRRIHMAQKRSRARRKGRARADLRKEWG